MGTRGKALHIVPEIFWIGNGAKLFFPLAFRPRRSRGVAEQRLLLSNNMGAKRRKGDSREKKTCHTIHVTPWKERPVFCLKAGDFENGGSGEWSSERFLSARA